MTASVEDLVNRYPMLETCANPIKEAIALMIGTFRAGGKVLLAGNGGSAADSDHISGELLKGFAQPRPIVGEDRRRLGENLADNLQGGLPAIPLPQFASLISAFGNDCNPEYSFAQLTWALGKRGDCLFAISTSGNSKNILHAVDVARAKDMSVIGLSSSSGKLRLKSDISIDAPASEVHLIQELHLPIYHSICTAIEHELFG